MEPLLSEPATDPLPLYRYRDGIVAVDLLGAAIAHLDFFTWLAEHPATLGAICAHFEIHPRPADVMLTLFTAMGLVHAGGGCFHLTLRAREHLVAGSPWNLAPYYVSMKDRPQTLDMLKVLRTGKPANWGSYDPQAWAQAMERDDFAAAIHRGDGLPRRAARAGAGEEARSRGTHRALLDVAGGSGIYACALVAQHPHLRAAVFEKPPVDRIARECIAAEVRGAGRGGRGRHVRRAPGRAASTCICSRTCCTTGTNRRCATLLAKSHAALAPGGLLLVHDAFINAGKDRPAARRRIFRAADADHRGQMLLAR